MKVQGVGASLILACGSVWVSGALCSRGHCHVLSMCSVGGSLCLPLPLAGAARIKLLHLVLPITWHFLCFLKYSVSLLSFTA